MQVQLVMLKSDGSRREFPLLRSRTVLGRTSEADLRIPLPSVSRRHCEITLKDGAVHIRDLGSSNGTIHNRVQVTEATLSPGDRIEIGGVEFMVVIDGVGAEAPATAAPVQPVQAAAPVREDAPTLVEPPRADAAPAPVVAALAAAAAPQPQPATQEVEKLEPVLADDEDDSTGTELPTVILEPGPAPAKRPAPAKTAPTPRRELLEADAAAAPATKTTPAPAEAEQDDPLAALAAQAKSASPAKAPAAGTRPVAGKPPAEPHITLPPSVDEDPISALERLAAAQKQVDEFSLLTQPDDRRSKPAKK